MYIRTFNSELQEEVKEERTILNPYSLFSYSMKTEGKSSSTATSDNDNSDNTWSAYLSSWIWKNSKIE